MGTKLEQEPQRETRTGTEWEQSGIKNLKMGTRTQKLDFFPKVGQEWEQSGKKNLKSGTRMGTKWEQKPESGTRMGTN